MRTLESLERSYGGIIDVLLSVELRKYVGAKSVRVLALACPCVGQRCCWPI